MTRIPVSRTDLRDASLLTGAFLAIGLMRLSRSFDNSAFTYAVIAEYGGFKFQQLSHPLYIPFLRAARFAARAAGFNGPLMPLFQLVSLSASSLTVGLSFLTARAWRASRWESGGVALLVGFWGSFLYFSVQTKPYALASLMTAAFAYSTAAPSLTPRRRGLLMGASAAAAAGFSLVAIGLLPAAALSGFLAPGRERREQATAILIGYLPVALLAAALAWVQARDVLGPFDAAEFAARSAPDASLLTRTAYAQLGVLVQSLGRSAFEAGLCAAALFFGILLGAHFDREVAGAPLICAATILGYCTVFFVVDAGNDFIYAVYFMVPFAISCLLSARRRAVPVLAFAAGVLIVRAATAGLLAVAADRSESYRVEGEFLMRATAANDVILSAGPIDWKLLYFYRNRRDFRALAIPGTDRDPFGRPLLSFDARVAAFVRAALAGHHGVLLAADMFYRGSGLTAAEWTRRLDLLQQLLKDFPLGAPRVSPEGQYYYPLQAPRR